MVAALLVVPAPIQAQAAETGLPVSLARIRAALEAPPPRLQPSAMPAEVPTFRVEVHQPFPISPLVEEGPGDPTMGIPSAGELLVGGIGKIHSAFVGYTRNRAKRKAKQEVAEALAAFCAVNACPAPAPAK
jgi:hypothetical protein